MDCILRKVGLNGKCWNCIFYRCCHMFSVQVAALQKAVCLPPVVMCWCSLQALANYRMTREMRQAMWHHQQWEYQCVLSLIILVVLTMDCSAYKCLIAAHKQWWWTCSAFVCVCPRDGGSVGCSSWLSSLQTAAPVLLQHATSDDGPACLTDVSDRYQVVWNAHAGYRLQALSRCITQRVMVDLPAWLWCVW